MSTPKLGKLPVNASSQPLKLPVLYLSRPSCWFSRIRAPWAMRPISQILLEAWQPHTARLFLWAHLLLRRRVKLDVILSHLPTLLTFRSGGREMGKELSHSGASPRHLQSSSFMFPLITHLSCRFHGAAAQNRTEGKARGRGTLQCPLLVCQSLQLCPAVLPLGQT